MLLIRELNQARNQRACLPDDGGLPKAASGQSPLSSFSLFLFLFLLSFPAPYASSHPGRHA